MRSILLLMAALFSTAASAAPPAATPTPAARQDVRCLVLFLVAADAPETKELETAALMGVSYFMGRIRTHSPGLDLASAVLGEIDGLEGNPAARSIGERCDQEVDKAGQDLLRISERIRAVEDSKKMSSR